MTVHSGELERRAALLELTTDLVLSATIDGSLTYMNAGGRALLEWEPDEDVTQRRIADVHPPWAAALIMSEALPSAVSDGVWRGETAILTRSGNEIPVSQVIVVHRNPAGEVDRLSTIMRDIRDRRAIENELRDATRMFQLVMDYIPQFVFWKDRNSVYQGCNRNFAEVAGVGSVEAIVGKTDFDLAWKRQEAEFFRTVDAEVMAADEPRTHILEPQLQADGKEAWLDTSKIPLHDDAGAVVGILGMYEDVTAQREAEDQRRQSQKLDSIGELAGGVAHDFNNMLTVISGSAELLAVAARTSDEPDRLGGLADEILDAVDSASRLTQKLLEFSRKGPHAPEPVDFHEIVSSATALLRRTVDRRISIVTEFEANSGVVFGDPSQLQNLILNLCLNARDSMPNGGQLYLGTRTVKLEAGDPRAGAFDIEPGEHLEFVVRDEGVGIPGKTVERIFDPFFTTKAVGAGTGLGLSAVHSTAVDHRGAVSVHSEPGEGTTFRVYLPQSRDLDRPVAARPRETPRGSGQILLVDDEEMVRNVASSMLTSLGYDVTMAKDGLEAVEIFAAKPNAFDLVILDMVMPNLSGRQTCERLRELSTDLCILYSSGFTRERTLVPGDGVRGFVKKPYRLDELARQVARALVSEP